MELEIAGGDNQSCRSQPAIDQESRHDQKIVVGQALGQDYQVNLAILQGGAALRLHWQIHTICQPVDQRIDAPISERQEDVQQSAGLFRQRRPQPKLEHLPGRARLAARPGPGHGAELIAGYEIVASIEAWWAFIWPISTRSMRC